MFITSAGRITLSQWSEAMEAVTNFKLPWRLLREKLAVVNLSNEIVYANTLQMIESDDIVSWKWTVEIDKIINETFT